MLFEERPDLIDPEVKVDFEYAITNKAFRVRSPRENYLVGQFGQLTLVSNIANSTNSSDYSVSKFCAWRVELKIKGEHHLGKEKVELEVVVYHQRKID